MGVWNRRFTLPAALLVALLAALALGCTACGTGGLFPSQGDGSVLVGSSGDSGDSGGASGPGGSSGRGQGAEVLPAADKLASGEAAASGAAPSDGARADADASGQASAAGSTQGSADAQPADGEPYSGGSGGTEPGDGASELAGSARSADAASGSISLSGSASGASSGDADGARVDICALAAGDVVTPAQVAAYGEDACFTVEQIDDATFQRMKGLSYKDDCTVPRDELRYIRVLHVTAEGETRVGELVMNVKVAQDVCDIFHELYRAGYPIHKMHLVDDYGADDDASMEDDNTSAFNYRLIAGTSQMSNHAYGMAIDINPYHNPYCIPSQDYVSPASAYEYGNRAGSWPYKIEEGDLCHRLFLEAGFTWGGYWDYAKDYQHFEKL